MTSFAVEDPLNVDGTKDRLSVETCGGIRYAGSALRGLPAGNFGRDQVKRNLLRPTTRTRRAEPPKVILPNVSDTNDRLSAETCGAPSTAKLVIRYAGSALRELWSRC